MTASRRTPAAAAVVVAVLAAVWYADARPAAVFSVRPRSFVLALTGDSVITRPLSGDRDEAAVGVRRLLKSADAAFTNLEMVFHDFQPWAMPSRPSLASQPALARELFGEGFRLVSRANNHAADYGARGIRLTSEAVRRAGLVGAGVGEDLAQARRAAILGTPKGRVALICAASTFPEYARATAPHGRIRGRPGVNPLRFTTLYVVRPDQLESLRETMRDLGRGAPPKGEPLEFEGLRFAAGAKPEMVTEARADDVEAIAAAVREARRRADYVLVSIHAHEWESDVSSPARFLVGFAHAMIDAGADVVAGHGPHRLRGIEIYRDRPIFYSLGNFLFEYETLRELPSDDYEFAGLGPDARVGDVFDRYDRGGSAGYPADPQVWESVVALVRWNEGGISGIELHPVTLGGDAAADRGRPRLASSEAAASILDRLSRLSSPFGTRIESRGPVGAVSLRAYDQSDR